MARFLRVLCITMIQNSNRVAPMHRISPWFVVAAGLAVLAGCTEKSRNPLSPSIAGPIVGVSLTAPGLMSPTDGALIKVDDQPVRVTFANGVSDGERPVAYNVQLALDSEFRQVVHEATQIPADPSGQTTHELPAGLNPETTYYWQVQTDDGANASELSGASSFEVFTPVVIEPPQIQALGADTGKAWRRRSSSRHRKSTGQPATCSTRYRWPATKVLTMWSCR